MRKLPLIFTTSTYKYTILARLSLLKGAESQAKKSQKALVNYLERMGTPRTTTQRWLKIELNDRTEIPAKVLLQIKDWFNRKYSEQAEGSKFEIHLEDLLHPELKE
jgi:hypothetical protein